MNCGDLLSCTVRDVEPELQNEERLPSSAASSRARPSRLLLLVSCYHYACDQQQKEDIAVPISSLCGHYLFIFMFIPGPLSHVVQMSSEQANGPTQHIELHVPLFTGKAGLRDNKKGDI